VLRLWSWLREAFDSAKLDAEIWCDGRHAWPRALLLAYLTYAGLRYGVDEDYRSWFSGITLAFHEMGHLLFVPFGNTMHLLGGSLLQIAVPLIAALYLWLRQGDFFGLAVGGGWLSFSLWELAIYVFDARREKLALVGFSDDPQHDWSTLLTRWHVLNYGDHFAWLIRIVAVLTWAAAIALGAWLCWRMWRSGNPDPAPGAGS
jgi:hypothetical protein